jgi:3'-phosphoadenosine 5'-phosphosulfate sulfotransferase (PAPS reductase)/FAD synthetase
MLHEILRAYNGQLPGDVRVLFANTGKEREETLRFVHDCATNWGVRVHWVEWRDTDEGFEEVGFNSASRKGEPFEALIAKEKFLPNWQARFCTSNLKIEAMTSFIKSIGLEPGTYSEVIGLRHDEGLRIFKMLENNEKYGRRCIAPLASAKATIREVMEFWAEQSFDLALLPGEGNCDLCFLKGRRLRKQLIRQRPSSADWWSKQETERNGFFDRRDQYADLKAEALSEPDMFIDIMTNEHDAECGLLCQP